MSTVIERGETEPPSGLVGILEPVGRLSVMVLFAVLDRLMQWQNTGKRLSYDYQHRRLRVSGESENSGETVPRIRALYGILNLHTYIWMVVFAITVYAGTMLSVEGTLLAAAVGAVLWVCLGMVVGAKAAINRTEIIDHTTEPLPDDLDDLKQQFVDGDLDDSEFEAQLEKRLTEVDG